QLPSLPAASSLAAVHTGTPAARPARAEAKAGPRAVPLTAELVELDAARAALAGGDATRALGLLDAYTRAHPSGRLELEADMLRIDALAQSGRKDLARKRAEQFLRRHPKSVLAPRARGFLDD